ncbi:hypothetical protein Y032_0028g1693 [Ancylostoma ceylanicum]|uniref:Uncharacterized protein n=1 Tax=Ancylostoma ceylanicum TaxID=53326 RepID=A0A016UT71_9BILA|nr:hypothetical protein Y032_0028g1693 [Ancylostoma ceylanicum]
MLASRSFLRLRNFSAAVQNASVPANYSGRYQNWKKPVYVSPHIHPLEVGPDFSVIEGPPIPVTSQKQLEYKLDQIRLAKKVVQLLEEIKEMETAHKKADARRLAESQQKEQLRPKPKGTISVE